MDIKSPKMFETSDKAHADLFNDMVKVLLENDTGLLDQLGGHIDDTKPHASEAEKKKWNESQLYKITADDGKYLISVPADKNIYDAIKDKGTCTFIASPGVEDSPAPSNAYLRGIQTVGQDKIGTGFAVDTSGNAYYFYYNSSHISITWTQLPTAAEKDKWNNGQLSKITADNGMPLISLKDTSMSILDAIINNGVGQGTFYAISGSKDLPNQRSFRGFCHMTDSTNGKASFGWVYATDYLNNIYTNYLNNSIWSGWKRILTAEDVANSTFVDTYDQNNSSVSAAENVATKLVFGATRADDLSEYNRSRAEITLKNSGLYLIRLYVTSNNITVGSDNILACYVNGSEYQRFGNWNPATSSSTCVLYLLQKFKAEDKVTFYITPRGTNKTVSINTAYVTMSQLR
ncbi:hypothetical protein P9173_03170 [Bacillus safensis]|uniref:hypothetical protein n=1 Tax=Bacillus safensis TaxID=561879 RepID=UPI00227E8639|nr:hypothetical protein [Bacillus safensis]MCY7543884.1 hypothetical protein [Bacillus safensis]MCY7550372.1 hypothetical protein [Bacillus safensis]MCY7644020.1 hypothetical protein [Bacillus safensis]MCY7654542.1 hypothetical protein [Bacillus safensis]MEC3709143.1 hypothetical protein [Bacillus safensis]